MSLRPTDEQIEFQSTIASFFAAEASLEYIRKRAVSNQESDPNFWTKIQALQLFEFFSSNDPEFLPTLTNLGIVAFESGRALSAEPLWESLLAGPYLHTRLLSARERAKLPSHTMVDALANGTVRVTLVETPDLSFSGGKVTGSCLASGAVRSVNGLLLVGERRVVFVPSPGRGLVVRREPSLDLTRPLYSIKFRNLCGSAYSLKPLALRTLCYALAARELAGIGNRVVEITGAYTKERRQFGVPVGGFQAVQHALADMYLRAESSRALSHFACWCFDHSKDQFAFAAEAAFRYAADWAPWICERAIQLHGGVGFTWEFDLHFFLRRARSIIALHRMPEHDEFLALEGGRK